MSDKADELLAQARAVADAVKAGEAARAMSTSEMLVTLTLDTRAFSAAMARTVDAVAGFKARMALLAALRRARRRGRLNGQRGRGHHRPNRRHS